MRSVEVRVQLLRIPPPHSVWGATLRHNRRFLLPFHAFLPLLSQLRPLF
jgi:hypothetical protein